MEKQAQQGNERQTDESREYEKLCGLYDQVNAAGGMIREYEMPKGFMAAIGDIQDFRQALGLDPDDETIEITDDMMNTLPPMLLFAYPGSGVTRVEAIQDGMKGWQDSKETMITGRILHGSFSIGGGTMSAYMPASADDEQQWTVEFVKGGEVVFTEHIDMIYAPVFGPDVEDIDSLNRRIEVIITERNLE
jgi:hypothetical protein